MKKVFSFAIFLSISACSIAQTYSGPESVVYDTANKRYLISNNGNNRILSRNSSGVLSIFTTAITSGPHGLEIVGDTLYACDGGAIKAFSLTTAALIYTYLLGGSFMNGICTDGSTYVYATDFTARKIYKLNVTTRTFTTFVTATGNTPNGIVYDGANNRLIFCCWGTNAPIRAVNLTTAAVSTITSTTLGNCDGIVRDGAGNYYVSAWNINSIVKFNNTFTGGHTVVVSGLSGPADIYYNLATDTLVSPNSGNNTVTFHYMGVTSAHEVSHEKYFSSLYPNPVENSSKIVFRLNTEEQVSIVIYDGAARKVITPVNKKLLKGEYEIPIGKDDLSQGRYFYIITVGKKYELKNFVVTDNL